MPDTKTFAIGMKDEMVTVSAWRDGVVVAVEDEEGRHIAFLTSSEAVDLGTAIIAAAASAE